MTGPNRFLRRFTGNTTKAGKNAAVAASYAIEPGSGKLAVYFKLTNTGSTTLTFTIASNNYRTDGPWTYAVPAGASATDYFNAVAYTGGWYDFTVTVDADTTWSQPLLRPPGDRHREHHRLNADTGSRGDHAPGARVPEGRQTVQKENLLVSGSGDRAAVL